jgi:hypothetical protein
MRKLLNAARVIAYNGKIRQFLEQNDPMALKQLDAAIVDGEETVEKVGELLNELDKVFKQGLPHIHSISHLLS